VPHVHQWRGRFALVGVDGVCFLAEYRYAQDTYACRKIIGTSYLFCLATSSSFKQSNPTHIEIELTIDNHKPSTHLTITMTQWTKETFTLNTVSMIATECAAPLIAI